MAIREKAMILESENKEGCPRKAIGKLPGKGWRVRHDY
jgi:hypothetical protein